MSITLLQGNQRVPTAVVRVGGGLGLGTDTDGIATLGSTAYDVTLYGATGDGVTDDSSAIQQAIDDASAASGGTVFFPIPGASYKISTPLVAASNVYLYGPGATLSFSGIECLGDGIGVSNVIIDGLIFDGSSAANSDAILFDSAASSEITVRAVEVKNCGTDTHSITVEGADRVRCESCWVHDCYRGIRIINTDDVHVHHCLIEDIGPGTAGGQIAILVWANSSYGGTAQCERVVVHDNTARGISDNAIRVFSQVYAGGTGIVRYASVAGNVIEDAGKDALRIQADNVSVVGNTARDCAEAGLRNNGAQKLTIVGNTFFADTDTPLSSAIVIGLINAASVGEDITIVGNTIYGPWDDGIEVKGDATAATTGNRATITGNLVKGTRGGSGHYGIYAFRWNDVVITGNTVIDCDEGICIDTVTNALIVGNHSADANQAAGTGIEVGSSVTGARIMANYSEGNNSNYTLASAQLIDIEGSGSPESSVTAAIGSVYRRTDGGTNTAVYVKESGTGNTGWSSIGTVDSDLDPGTPDTYDQGAGANRWRDIYAQRVLTNSAILGWDGSTRGVAAVQIAGTNASPATSWTGVCEIADVFYIKCKDTIVIDADTDGSAGVIQFRSGTSEFARVATDGIRFPVLTDATRGSAGTAGRVIFNSDDANLNIDDGTDWIMPDGSTA